MKQVLAFIETTLRGGLLVLFPLFACIFVLVYLANISIEFIKPFLRFLPEGTFIGIALADLLSILILVGLCCLTGTILKTSIGKRFGLRLAKLFDRHPGYRMFSRLAKVMFDQENAGGVPVIVNNGDTKQIGFLVEQHDNDEMTVFLPSSPSPLSGNVVIVQGAMVTRLDVSPAKVARVMATFGTGSRELLTIQTTSEQDRD
jgi:uncharacterized membrane protein